jgi:hypothetical protein
VQPSVEPQDPKASALIERDQRASAGAAPAYVSVAGTARRYLKDSLDRAYRHPYVVNSPEPELRALGALIELAARLQQQARTSALSGSRPHHQHPGPHATGENAQSREARLVGERAKLVRRIGAPH